MYIKLNRCTVILASTGLASQKRRGFKPRQIYLFPFLFFPLNLSPSREISLSLPKSTTTLRATLFLATPSIGSSIVLRHLRNRLCAEDCQKRPSYSPQRHLCSNSSGFLSLCK